MLCGRYEGQFTFVTFKRDATALARRRASAEARPRSEANGVGPQRRPPQGTVRSGGHGPEVPWERSEYGAVGPCPDGADQQTQRRARTERTRQHSGPLT